MKRTKNKKEQKNNHKIHKNGEKLNKHKQNEQQIRQIPALINEYGTKQNIKLTNIM